MKTINDYFKEETYYLNDIYDNILPYNTLLCYVSTNFLDGFINHVKPISCFVLDNYVEIDEKIEENTAHLSLKTDRYNYFYFTGTKRELIEGINSGVIQITHTKIHLFGDDVVILSKIDDKKYMFFEYNISGRCNIGRILTDDSEKDIIDSVYNYLSKMKSENTIQGFHSLKVENFIEGWVSF